MYHLINVNHNGMAVHLIRSDCEGSKAMDGTDDAMPCCGMTMKKMGMLGVSLRKKKALSVTMEAVTTNW